MKGEARFFAGAQYFFTKVLEVDILDGRAPST
jgi:hypothetical protein